MGTEAPLIREVVFHFFPDRTTGSVQTQKALEVACRASIAATGDYRKLMFSIYFPRRLPPVAEIEEVARAVDDIDSSVVDVFLEKLIKGAIDMYRSDQVLLCTFPNTRPQPIIFFTHQI
jgi:hypothetical protein